MDNTKPKGTFARLMQSTPLPPTPGKEKPAPAAAQLKVDLPERVNARTTVRPNGKRIITRNSFEIYEDQMDSLRRLSFEEKMDGKIGSMSAMVRAAIDVYLKELSKEK